MCAIDAEGDEIDWLVGAANGAEGCIEKFDQLAQAFSAAGNPVERSNIAQEVQKQVDTAQSGDEATYKQAK